MCQHNHHLDLDMTSMRRDEKLKVLVILWLAVLLVVGLCLIV